MVQNEELFNYYLRIGCAMEQSTAHGWTERKRPQAGQARRQEADSNKGADDMTFRSVER